MIFFINLLRALAMCLITNSHYVGVYPTDLIANGGLLGDVIFFAVSGFCLSNPKLSFPKWYLKRILRIYPIVWLIVLFYWAIGKYSINGLQGFFSSFIFPTQYHFVGSIILLYIPFYIFAKGEKALSTKKGLKKLDPTVVVFFAIAVVWLLVYVIFYDKSYYHIDTVREPMIWFLYFEAMLIGYCIKKNLSFFENKKGIIKWFATAMLFVLYFISKLLFSKRASVSEFQILNQFVLLMLMCGIFVCTASLSGKLDRLPAWLKAAVNYLAKITLEIYVVQSVIIDAFKGMKFPVNWLVITGLIVIAATVLHYIIEAPKLISKGLKRKKEVK